MNFLVNQTMVRVGRGILALALWVAFFTHNIFVLIIPILYFLGLIVGNTCGFEILLGKLIRFGKKRMVVPNEKARRFSGNFGLTFIAVVIILMQYWPQIWLLIALIALMKTIGTFSRCCGETLYDCLHGECPLCTPRSCKTKGK